LERHYTSIEAMPRSGRKAAGTVRIVPRKTTTTTSTPAKGVEEISEGDDSIDGEPAIDLASMSKEVRVMQKQFAQFIAAQRQKKANFYLRDGISDCLSIGFLFVTLVSEVSLISREPNLRFERISISRRFL